MWATALLTAAMVAGTPSAAPAYDVDVEFVESYRGEQLRFGRGGRAFVWIERVWHTDQLHWLNAHPTPIWHACVSVVYRNGDAESECGGTRVRSAFVDPLLRSSDFSFSVTSPASPPFRVELHTRERARTDSRHRVVPSRSISRADGPGVRFFAEGAGWRRDSRPQVTRGWIKTPSGRHLQVRTVSGRGGRLARSVRASATTGWWRVGPPPGRV